MPALRQHVRRHEIAMTTALPIRTATAVAHLVRVALMYRMQDPVTYIEQIAAVGSTGNADARAHPRTLTAISPTASRATISIEVVTTATASAAVPLPNQRRSTAMCQACKSPPRRNCS